MNEMPVYGKWISVSADEFWTDIARQDHVVQLYENDGVFLDTLTGFIEATIYANENVVVIATDRHLSALEARLQTYGVEIEKMISENRFIPFNVEEIIAEFMIDGSLDEGLLLKLTSDLLVKASYGNRRFKMFGEIAPTLMAQGYKDIPMRVEQIFDRVFHEHKSCVYCGYSKKLFTGELLQYRSPVCELHSKIISGSVKQLTHVLYQQMPASLSN
jgi:hypothetical protein